jgi:hypothetical protein
MILDIRRRSNIGTKLASPTKYRSLVSALQYLCLTRPNIAYLMNKVYQFLATPTTKHTKVAKHILRYLKGIVTHGLYYTKSNPTLFHDYNDVD